MKRLLTESKMNFNKATEIGVAMEIATRDTKKNGATAIPVHSMHILQSQGVAGIALEAVRVLMIGFIKQPSVSPVARLDIYRVLRCVLNRINRCLILILPGKRAVMENTDVVKDL